MKIAKNISETGQKPVKTHIGDTSFELSYNYAKGQLTVNGNSLENNKAKAVMIRYLDNNIILRKAECTLKNVTEILTNMFSDDKLPRCEKCGSRPIGYSEYRYYSIEVNTDGKSLPMVNEFHIMIPSISCDKPAENDEVPKEPEPFVIAECICGNQWKLENFSGIFDIERAYKKTFNDVNREYEEADGIDNCEYEEADK
jgi:hypothetical protein